MRSQPRSWTTLFTKLGVRPKKQQKRAISSRGRKLRFEQFEDRCMLATFFVNDAGDFTDDSNENVTSLREAIDKANVSAEADTIVFTGNLDGATINLSDTLQSLPTITKSLTIDASNLFHGITIDAGDGPDNIFGTGDGFRVFEINLNLVTADTEVKLDNLTITGGDAADEGGGIFFYGDPNAGCHWLGQCFLCFALKPNRTLARSG